MKKLIIIAGLICSAFFANAAAVTWSGTFSLYDWTNDQAAKGTILITIAGVDQALLTINDDGDAEFSYTIEAGQTVKALATITNFADGTGTKTYETTYAGQGSYPSEDDALIALTSEINGPLDADSNGLDLSATAADNTYTPVPEPTSGLLLILGMAGLALRRRHA